MPWLAGLAALAALNGWTLLRFRQDKARAVAGLRRIPEANLLGLALLGGSPGAFLGRRLFRHKTKKQPFSDRLYLIAFIQAGVLIGLLVSAAMP